jgi:RNA polymerase sigma factor (sigma-70 family)
MGGFSGDQVAAGRPSGSLASPAANYRRFLAILSARARRLGSRDPEGAAQEALRRSFEHPLSQPAVEYYFSENPAAGLKSPEWQLDQLLAWLHGVVTNVVREDQNRASSRREVSIGENDRQNHTEPADPAAGQLDALLQAELEGIISECLPMIEGEYQTVLKMRADGLKYSQIATRLGVNENTVATWVSRGIRELGDRVRKRIARSFR